MLQSLKASLPQPSVALAVLLVMGPGCKCASEKGAQDLASYLSAEADIVVEISDLGFFANNQELINKLTSGITTPEQMKAFQAEVKKGLGFDLFTKEGLEAAGLPSEGAPLSCHIKEDGEEALLVLPVTDPEKFEAVLKALGKMSGVTDPPTEKEIDGQKLKQLSSKFGTQEIPFATYAFNKGAAFIGAGKSGGEVVVAALKRAKDKSVAAHPEYMALAQTLSPKKGLVRVYLPHFAAFAKKMSDQVPGGAPPGTFEDMKSMGWSVGLDAEGIAVDGSMRSTAKGIEKMKKVAAVKAEAPKGVRATQEKDALLFMLWAFNLEELIKQMSEDPTFKKELEEARPQVKELLGVELDELVKMFSGHVAFAGGWQDASKVTDLVAQKGNPLEVFWLDMATGLSDADGFKKLGIGEKIAGMASMGRTKEEVDGVEVESFSMDKRRPKRRRKAKKTKAESLFDMFIASDAWTLSMPRTQTEKLIKNAKDARPDPLGGKAGFYMELQFAPLLDGVKAVDFDKLGGGAAGGMMVKMFLDKILLGLGRLDRAWVRFQTVPDGMSVDGKVLFALSK